jgi:hypothetical protein
MSLIEDDFCINHISLLQNSWNWNYIFLCTQTHPYSAATLKTLCWVLSISSVYRLVKFANSEEEMCVMCDSHLETLNFCAVWWKIWNQERHRNRHLERVLSPTCAFLQGENYFFLWFSHEIRRVFELFELCIPSWFMELDFLLVVFFPILVLPGEICTVFMWHNLIRVIF